MFFEFQQYIIEWTCLPVANCVKTTKNMKRAKKYLISEILLSLIMTDK